MLRTIAAMCKAMPSFIRPFQHSFNTTKSSGSSVLLKYQSLGFKTSIVHNDIMEFFDEKSHWGESLIKVGRAWNVEELRIKSNVDLHKLWYVLLKERNMLLTMEHECNDQMKLFPNPERIDKVKISMNNLQQVVMERNKAYYLLETGDDGERKYNLIKDSLGLRKYVRETEHIVPRHMNRTRFVSLTRASRKFIMMYKENLFREKGKQRNRDRNHVLGLFKRFPNMDRAELKRRYPHLDVDKLAIKRKAEGHFAQD